MSDTALSWEARTSGRAGWAQAVRAEWLKLRSVRSTGWALLVLLGISILFTAWAASESETQGGSPGRPGDNDIVLDSLAGIWFGQIGAAVLAVLAITSEYGSGTIRASLAANPRRATVLAAKTGVVTAVVFVVGLVASIACFFVGQSILRGNGFTYENGYATPSLADGPVFRAVVGSAVCLGLLAIFCVGVGAVVRHTAGALTLVLALILAPVVAIGFLPESAGKWVEKTSLLGAELSVQQTVDRPDNIPLEPWMGFAVVGAYAAVALTLGFWSIMKRDA